MSKIKAKDSKPELILRKKLWSLGYRYRIHPKSIPGKPDIVMRKFSLAIFVDGEFWHGKDWHFRKPKLKKNRDFWIAKIERNMQRDREVNSELNSLGYTVLRFWETEIKKLLDNCIKKIVEHIINKEKENDKKL